MEPGLKTNLDIPWNQGSKGTGIFHGTRAQIRILEIPSWNQCSREPGSPMELLFKKNLDIPCNQSSREPGSPMELLFKSKTHGTRAQT